MPMILGYMAIEMSRLNLIQFTTTQRKTIEQNCYDRSLRIRENTRQSPYQNSKKATY